MRSCYVGGIFVQFGALRGAPGVMYGRYTIPGGEGGGRNQKDLTGDRFQVIVPLFTHEDGGQVRSGYLGGVFGHFGALRGAPGVRDG